MRFVVCVKQVPDTAAPLDVRPDALRPHLAGVELVMNPFDEFALEEALRLRDLHGGTVTLLTLATTKIEDAIFHGLAMGADDAIILDASSSLEPGPAAIAEELASALRALVPDLILCGERSVDDDAGIVGPMIAGLLGMPQFTGVERIDVGTTAENIRVRCRRSSGLEIHDSTLPAVAMCVRGEQPPRYATMDGIFDAGMKPVETRIIAMMTTPGARRISLRRPHEERVAEILAGAEDVAAQLLLERIAERVQVLQ